MIHVTARQKVTQRNITPILNIVKSDSRPKVIKNGHKYSTPTNNEENNFNTRTDQERSHSKYSKCSFETHHKVILRHSKLSTGLIIQRAASPKAKPLKQIPSRYIRSITPSTTTNTQNKPGGLIPILVKNRKAEGKIMFTSEQAAR